MSSARDTTAVLRRRSAALARPAAGTDHTPTSEVLVVTVAGRRFGLDGQHVSQVLQGPDLCRLPHGCGALTALVSSRGAAVPVADLGELLGSEGQNNRPYVVLLEGGESPVGVLVDTVHEVRPLAARDVRATPGARGGALEVGVTTDGLVLLDLPRLLADPRLHPRSATAPPRSPHPQENHVSDDHR